ncbi:hypothetical protein QZH41_010901 [Actinostola sp. cb2023]|nr:hypothetical protein QZH41_010901 [Actinostola sp. cb2023]
MEELMNGDVFDQENDTSQAKWRPNSWKVYKKPNGVNPGVEDSEERPNRKKSLLNPPDPVPKFGAKGHLLDDGTHTSSSRYNNNSSISSYNNNNNNSSISSYNNNTNDNNNSSISSYNNNDNNSSSNISSYNNTNDNSISISSYNTNDNNSSSSTYNNNDNNNSSSSSISIYNNNNSSISSYNNNDNNNDNNNNSSISSYNTNDNNNSSISSYNNNNNRSISNNSSSYNNNTNDNNNNNSSISSYNNTNDDNNNNNNNSSSISSYNNTTNNNNSSSSYNNNATNANNSNNNNSNNSSSSYNNNNNNSISSYNNNNNNNNSISSYNDNNNNSSISSYNNNTDNNKQQQQHTSTERHMEVYVEDIVSSEPCITDDDTFALWRDKLVPFREGDKLENKIDFIICLGGDGTLLYASTLFQGSCPPIMAFHLGSLGFLTSFRFENFREDITRVLDGHAALTLRSRLKCDISKQKDKSTATVQQCMVLNEVVVDRGPSSYLCFLDIYCNDHHITSVQGDGVILSTPTGSTAYAVAAGASMVHPSVPAILITPVCPHSLSFRPIILPAGVEIKVVVNDQSRQSAWASFDGRNRQELCKGDSVRLNTSIYPVPSVNSENQISDWFRSLAECLHWNVREKQRNYSFKD